ncbi:MAG: hypothetical protein ACYS29_13070 [Planctomycetota bacterium]
MFFTLAMLGSMGIVKQLLLVISLGCSVTVLRAGQDVSLARARASARIAGYSLGKVQRWLHERCLPAIDKETGLARWQSAKQWNYRDTAADCYPFVIWAAFYTDWDVLNGPMREILEAEQKLCNHIDRLPVDYDLTGHRKFERTLDQIIFGASEYAKDGLVPIVELTGPNQWYDRLKAITDDIFKNAKVDTPYGKIPSDNIEVNGELLQVLPRLYAMTGENKYLDWAHRLADYYLKPGKFVPKQLSDHGCEIIGGLGMLLAVDSTACPERFKEYEPHIRYMCDEIIRRGTNSDGIIISRLQSQPGPHDNVTLRDGWGYDYVAFLDYDLAAGRNRYQKQVEFALSNLLKPRYKNFNWDHNSRDNLADSVEGGLYLLNRLPVTKGFQWADREIAETLVDVSDPDRLWETHKLEANTVRTVLIHAMMHTQNTIARPWRRDMQLGARAIEGGIAIVAKTDKPYLGRLEFDIPRHRIYIRFEKDWPRMNTMPEWFTVEPDNRYVLKNVTAGSETVYTGKQLHKGVPLELQAAIEQRLVLTILQK